MLRYICSLPNPGLKGKPHELFYTDDETGRARAQEFIARENGRPGRGIYYCLGKLKEGATSRCKETVGELEAIVTDLDLKNIEQPREEVLACLQGLLLPPYEIRNSGFGLHAEWRFKEPVNDDAGLAEAEAIMKQLVELLAGDPAPTHRAALLRQPETDNTKEPPPRRCHAIWRGGKECDISEFADMFDMYGDRPLLTRKAQAEVNGCDPAAADDGLALDTREFRTADDRFDVDAWFAEMPPTGKGANEFQPKALTALLWEGTHPDDCVGRIADATIARAAGAGLGWTREKEIREVTKRCMSSVGRLHRMYDPSTGVIPPWLAGEFHDAWAAALTQGKLPQLTRNKAGWYIRAYGGAEGESKKDGNKPSKRLILRPFEPFNVATLPPRRWLYGKHYQRRTVSLTAGPGGMGKSSLDLVEAIAMATARNLLGEQPEERLRVWYHNGEDPFIEIMRRVAAICQHYSISQEELPGYLFITSGNEFPLRVAKGYASLEIDVGLLGQISACVADREIDIAVFDPLVTLHSVSEIDTGKMDTVIRLFAGIADENDAAIELAHHVRKPAAGVSADYDVNDIRGVTAITDAVRAARLLNRMNEKDAEAAGCDEKERLSRFRVDRAKGNYSPPQAATWRQFINIELPNSDEVGVVASWDFPGQGELTPGRAAADQKAEQVFLVLLDKFLARGQNVSANSGPTHAPSKFADEQEARKAKVSKAALKAAMSRLLDAGRIRAEPTGRGDRSSHRLIPWHGTPE
jgi:RecA-family ATPase